MDTAANLLTATAESPRATRREWLGLAVIALPCFLYAMDLTVLELALPRIAADLKPTSAQLLWIIDVYGFFVAGLLITMGNLGDRIGRRRLLLIGAVAFGVASVGAAMARTTGMLIVARALLGIAGATVAPSTLSLIRNMFLHPRQRTVAVGVWTASYSTGGALGPLLGGLILQRFHWGAVFLLAVPVMALLLLSGPILLPESRDPAANRVDVGSAALSLAAVLAVIYGMKASVQDGPRWSSLLCLAVGICAAVAFVRRQQRVTTPLVDVRLFQSRLFSVSLAMYLVITLLAFGVYMLLAQYLQLVLGLSPLAAGIWMLPWSASYVAGSFLAPALARRFQPALVIAGGLALAALGYLAASRAVAIGPEPLLVASTVYSLGMSPVFTLGIDAIVTAAPADRAGAAAALSETGAELGGAVGVAVLGTIASAVYRAGLSPSSLAAVPAEARRAAMDTLSAATVAAAQLPDEGAGAALLEIARHAYTHAAQVTLVLCAVICAVLAVVAFVALPRTRGRRAPRKRA